MSMKILKLFMLMLYLIRGVQLRPSLAELVNAIGVSLNISSISVIYNSTTADVYNETYLNEFLSELYQRGTSYFGQRTQITGDQYNRLELAYSIEADALVVTFALNVNDEILNVTAMSVRRRRHCYTIFVVKEVHGQEELNRLFRWLWVKQFRKPLVVANRKELYTFIPYPELRVKNVTGAPIEDFFPVRDYGDYLGYKLRVPVQQDIPQTFGYCQNKTGRFRLDGIGGTVFRQFMMHMNVSLEPYLYYVNGSNILNISAITQLLIDERIEISPHLYNTLIIDEKIEYSYPFGITSRCFMIPLNNEIPRNLYLLLPFQWNVWLMLIAVIVFAEVAFPFWINNILPYEPTRELRLLARPGSVTFSALCVILAIPVPSLKAFDYSGSSLLTFLRFLGCYSTVAIFGLNVSQMYSTTLTSFLAVTLFSKPSSSVESLLADGYPIMIVKSEKEAIFGSDKFGHRNFDKLLTYADNSEIYLNRQALNTSYIYPISSFRWNFLNEQQRFLTRKRFWLSNVCSGDFALQYQMQFDSHFYKPLMYFMLKSREHGLFQYWRSSRFRKARQMGYMHYFRDPEVVFVFDGMNGVTLKLLSPMFYLYAGGLLLSVLAFLIELGSKVKINQK